ncbi:hypothetical protein SteCoe_20069 [Stentor coeruleus]|uniref:GB1/RHD3-type G domain-containing protein n=1 Tax=Stentor coeruleus TaxID=5963 RepID=A0A1R2BST8_9CILI|nr:hypothetical protein SteCoe_20069 [Stentor coeruleus]
MADCESLESFTDYEFTDNALPLLSYNQNTKKYELAIEALAMLKTLKGKISVITVAGLYRTGKSYLLNQVLLGRKNGFGVGPSINPCTKGMWIWGRPLLGRTSSGEPCSILLIDTEGIGALDEDSTHDSRVFSLAVLFSSCFIYNSVGSIDESALQSMSLVLNLAKHITAKSENSTSEDLSQYFPSFLWVVRDFSLQLVDENGKILTSKEYLEKALLPQKGNSEVCEEKNRIRTMIKTFFKSRECFTLVRPTTDEMELQHLDQKDIETLRPEFIAQTRELRSLVMTGIKLKEINGKALDGGMFSDLIRSYVDAINSGAAPCIESTWSYLCKNQLAKLLQECEDQYEHDISESIGNNFPVPSSVLKEYHKQAKNLAVTNFKSKAIGDGIDEILTKLKEKMKEKYETIFLNNQDECKVLCTRFLIDNYSLIASKLKKNQLKSFQEFEKELKILKEYAKGHCPVMDTEILYEFLVESISSGGDFFIKNLMNELNLQKDLVKDTVTRIENDFKETKDGLVKERDELRLKLSASENEKIELSLREKSATEKLEELKSDKENIEKDSRNIIKTLKLEHNEKLEESMKKCWEYEEKIKELERKIFQAQSDSNQEFALLQQKAVYLEKALADYESREQKAVSELKSYKLDHNNIIKELCSKQEEQLANYQNRLIQESEKTNELEKFLCEKEVEFEQLKIKYEETETRLENTLNEFKDSEEFNKTRLEQREKFFKQEWEKSIEKYENDLQHMKNSLAQAETKLKDYDNNKLQITAVSSKETAILEQKIEFLNQELKDTKHSLEEEKKHQQNLLASMSTMNIESSKDDITEEIRKLQERHEEELKTREDSFTIIKSELQKEIVYYKELVEELEIQNKVSQSHKTEKEQELSDEVDLLKGEKLRLLEKIKGLNLEYSKFVEETENKAKAKAKELEERAEHLISYYTRENSEIKTKHEEVIVQLKKYCEEDKARNEARVKEERDRAEKKYQLMCEEYERKIQEEQDHYESEMSSLQQELRELHERSTQEIQHLRHKSDFDSQKIETLEKYLSSTKDQISSIQAAQAQALDTHLQAFNCERNNLLDKIEKLASDNASKERTNANLAFRLEQVQAKSNTKEKELDEIKEQYNKERGLLIERLETAKQANNKLADEISQKKSDFKREIALANQHIEFQCKKIADLEKSLQENSSKYSDSFKIWRNESGIEFNETIEKLSSDKEQAEKKLEDNKKKLKDLEIKYSKQAAMMEKEKTLLTEKVTILESKKSDTEKRLQEEINDLKSQIMCSKDFDSLGRSVYLVENEKLKEKNNELEKAYAETSSFYERDKILWENKFTFLIQQRDQARNDLVDSQQKFDLALERLQKRGNLDRDKVGNATANLISSVEARYSAQIKEIHEKYTSTISELSQKNKALERELRSIKEDYEMEKRTRNSDSGSHGKKMQDLLNNEKKLIREIEECKASKDQKIKEIMEIFRTEKDNFKGKMHEYEQKIKELEHNKSQLFLEHEKERAKWALERDYLISQKNESQDIVDNLEKKKEALMKENEKLKANRGRMSSSRIDSASSVNKSYMTGIYANNVSFEEVTKEIKTNTCTSPGNTTNDFSLIPLRFKNHEGPKAFAGYHGELTRKPRRIHDENSRS